MKSLFASFSSFWKEVKDYLKFQPVFITADSQHYKLKEKMEEASMKHGTTAIVNLDNIKLKYSRGWKYNNLDLFFCEMKPIEVVKITEKGDGKDIPNQLSQINGFKVEKAGVYRIENVLLTSNGTMQMHKTRETKLILLEESIEAE
jgi:hypothetical protein